MRKQFAITLVAVVGLSTHASADDAKAEAKQHVARATSLHRDGQFAEALVELKTAYALDPQPQLLFAMGQLHVRLGQCTQAITFYERFLATRPARTQAEIATQAIETCKTAPPPADPPTRPSPVTLSGVSVDPVTVSPPPAPQEDVPAVRSQFRAPVQRPWYTNYVADSLVVGGVASGVAAIVLYAGARQDRADADGTEHYEAYAGLIDSAESKQTYALVFGGAGVALVTAGVLHFMFTDRSSSDHGMQVMPNQGGGTVSWSGRF